MPSDQQVPSKLWAHKTPAPQLSQVLSQVAGLLNDLGYAKTVTALQKDAAKNGVADLDTTNVETPLLDLYATKPAKRGKTGSSESNDEDSDEETGRDAVEGALVDVEAEETSDDDSDENDDSSSSSSSDSDSDSGDASSESADDPAPTGTKRKRVLTPSSSESSSSGSLSSSSSESDGSSDSDTRPSKRPKATSVSSSSSSSSVSSSSSSNDSDSDSDSSGSDSHSAASSSSSESSSDSESDSGSSSAPVPTKIGKKGGKDQKKSQGDVKKTSSTNGREGSQSSVTLDGDSPTPKTEAEAVAEEQNDIHPDRLKLMPALQQKERSLVEKKKQVPFSRIPSNQYVDPRFSSNAYVSYDYADRAHQDLIVTKGKGFTKEKNKKKRGAYRGGAIDLAPKGIKFDD